ncbi:MAG: LON peptidase substrate-binding domain-containing protein [Bacteroidales bacterium]|nr:LON peptidase substrate-binding domain-containing protein [Bacteroidales bacterium]
MKEDKKSGRIGIVMNSPDSMTTMIQLPDTDAPLDIDWDQTIGEKIYILPLRNNTLFPQIIMPIQADRKKSVELIKKAYREDLLIATVTQKNPAIDEPTYNDMYRIGTIVKVIKFYELPDGSITCLIHSLERVKLTGDRSDEFLAAAYKVVNTVFPKKGDSEFDALVTSIKDKSGEFVSQSTEMQSDAVFAIKNIASPGFLINFVASNIPLEASDKMKLLSINDLKKRGMELLSLLTLELQNSNSATTFKTRLSAKWTSNSATISSTNRSRPFKTNLAKTPTTKKSKTSKPKPKRKNGPKPLPKHSKRNLLA